MTVLPFNQLESNVLSSSMQRGACPALSAPMMTGDGLLARIALIDAISPAELAELAHLARRHGNGMIDISARGNLQVRGLTEVTAPQLDADVRELNLPLRDGLAVEIPPLAGLDETEIADPRPLAEAIREGAHGLAGLAPKMSVVVDGHGRLRLSDLLADIRLVAVRDENEIRWRLLLGGTEKSGRVFNVLRETQAVKATLDLLRQLSDRGPKARGRDLADELLSEVEISQYEVGGHPHPFFPLAGKMSAELTDGGGATNSTLESIEPPPSVAAGDISPARGERGSLQHRPNLIGNQITASPFDLFNLAEGLYAAGIGPAFGQIMAEDLITLCDEATRLGIKSLKPALDHSLIFFGLLEACEALNEFAAANGFITSKIDPRSHIAACPGSPACASANAATHDIAAHAAAQCGDLLDGSFKLHVTGCAKGCAHPQASALTLCGTSAGLSLIHQGKASEQPFATTAFADTNATLRRLADLVKSERRPSENSAACLARLGSERLAATVMPGGIAGRP